MPLPELNSAQLLGTEKASVGHSHSDLMPKTGGTFTGAVEVLDATEDQHPLTYGQFQSLALNPERGILPFYGGLSSVGIRPSGVDGSGVLHGYNGTALKAIPLSGELIADFDISGAGGLDTGSASTNTGYYLWWLTADDDTTDQILVLSLSADISTVTRPTGYTTGYYRLVFFVTRSYQNTNDQVRPFIVGPDGMVFYTGEAGGARVNSSSLTDTSWTVQSLEHYVPDIDGVEVGLIVEAENTHASTGAQFQLATAPFDRDLFWETPELKAASGFKQEIGREQVEFVLEGGAATALYQQWSASATQSAEINVLWWRWIAGPPVPAVALSEGLYATPDPSLYPGNGENHVVNWPPKDPDDDTGEVPQWWNQSAAGISIDLVDISAWSDRHREGIEVATDGSAGGEDLGIELPLSECAFLLPGVPMSIGTRVRQASGSTIVTLELYDSTGVIDSASVVTSTTPQPLVIENATIRAGSTIAGFRLRVADDSTTIQAEPLQWNRGPKLLPWRLPTSWRMRSYEEIQPATNPSSTADQTVTSSEGSLCYRLTVRGVINGAGTTGRVWRLAPGYVSSINAPSDTRQHSLGSNGNNSIWTDTLISDAQQLKWNVNDTGVSTLILRALYATYWGCAARP